MILSQVRGAFGDPPFEEECPNSLFTHRASHSLPTRRGNLTKEKEP